MMRTSPGEKPGLVCLRTVEVSRRLNQQRPVFHAAEAAGSGIRRREEKAI
jgi:hypothetical protein